MLYADGRNRTTQRGEAYAAAALVAVGFAVTFAFGRLSPEGIHHFDDLTHYLYAKWAWHWPAYLLDDWGRPGCTILYFLPAHFGWAACRVLSAALTAAGAWLAFRIAQRADLRPVWPVVGLAYVQPLLFQLAQTTLTETALACYLSLAVYLAQRGRWSWSAAAISLGAVTRQEAIIFLPIWVYFARRDGVAIARLWPLIWAPAAVNIFAAMAGLKPMILRLIEPMPSTQYGHGGWLTFFSRAMEAWGPGVTVLAMIGLRPLGERRQGKAVVACVVAYFGAQTIIRALGLFSSGGYARFLVPIGPLVAIAALAGWQRLRTADGQARRNAAMLAAGGMLVLWLAMERQLVLYAAGTDMAAELPGLHLAKWAIRVTTGLLLVVTVACVGFGSGPRSMRWTAMPVHAAIAVMILLTAWAMCRPLKPPPEAEIVGELQAWLGQHSLADREIVSAHIWLDYATGREHPPNRETVRAMLERAPIGTLFAWDRQFAASADHGLPLDEFLNSPAFRLIHRTRPAPYRQEPYLTIFEKLGTWESPPLDSRDRLGSVADGQ